jgi:hypothetical protein
MSLENSCISLQITVAVHARNNGTDKLPVSYVSLQDSPL